jgi:hypothetical protein
MGKYTTYEEFARIAGTPGGICVMPREALSQPCPKCGKHEGYNVSSDGYAYCNACAWGTSTEDPFTSQWVEILGPDGKPIAKSPGGAA